MGRVLSSQETKSKLPFKGRTQFNKRDGRMVDQRISVCSDCRRGIFNGQEYNWTSRGLVHTGCDDEDKVAA